MTGRRSHGRLSALNGVVHQGTHGPDPPPDAPGFQIRERDPHARRSQEYRLSMRLRRAKPGPGHAGHLSVSNSSSGRRWKLDHAPAVGDPTHMVEFGTGRRAFAREV